MNDQNQELAQPFRSSSAEFVKQQRKEKYLDLYKKGSSIAESSLPILENASEDIVGTIIHQRRVLSKEIGSLSIYQEKQHEKELTEAIKTGEVDPLTGIYNVRGFNRRLTEEVSEMLRNRTTGVLMYFDANDFSDVNNLLGHDKGDIVLTQIGLAITEMSRLGDVAARKGGDEYALLLPNISLEEAAKVWKRINDEFLKRHINISTGMAKLDPKKVEESKKQADIALYNAKERYASTHANEMVVYNEGMEMPKEYRKKNN